MAKARSLECASAIHACTGEPLQGRIVQPGHAAGLSFAVNWLQSLANVEAQRPMEEDFEDSIERLPLSPLPEAM